MTDSQLPKPSMGCNGVIGKSGKWYDCYPVRHIFTCQENIVDAPFVLCQRGLYAMAELSPTREQFETTMSWCTEMELVFEDVAISPAWERWLQDCPQTAQDQF